jgi:hypothetical protein
LAVEIAIRFAPLSVDIARPNATMIETEMTVDSDFPLHLKAARTLSEPFTKYQRLFREDLGHTVKDL